MPKIYTRTGDRGETGLFGGGRVPKDDPRVEAYGALDEANSALGLVATHLDADLAAVVRAMQRTLFEVGAELATPQPGRVPALGAEAVASLEALIDGWEAELDPLQTFILPGGCREAALCHLARALVRRAERRTVTLAREQPVNPEILRYLNRLSDCLFILARVLNRRAGVDDVPWEGRRGGPRGS
ncbi:MAG: cob(I)yrinic acid a,c-diamide adenosyltransferase [Armatimonadota bacterium]|nr:cob(I)yrinic acid a,c-diamide adenosyltransferase [Armatimonadota bacterium]MDR7518582.1 cob(I)yrinic acid a,c-diamide adenosyltransferase [Armatimonadota bacterium]MDR7549702.1 cob(I)yrinic acid a,c-diamide adenosyltransferase [Armatimonadota bacterium]